MKPWVQFPPPHKSLWQPKFVTLAFGGKKLENQEKVHGHS